MEQDMKESFLNSRSMGKERLYLVMDLLMKDSLSLIIWMEKESIHMLMALYIKEIGKLLFVIKIRSNGLMEGNGELI